MTSILAARTITPHAPWCDSAWHEAEMDHARDTHPDQPDYPACASGVHRIDVAGIRLEAVVHQLGDGALINVETSRDARSASVLDLTPAEAIQVAGFYLDLARRALAQAAT